MHKLRNPLITVVILLTFAGLIVGAIAVIYPRSGQSQSSSTRARFQRQVSFTVGDGFTSRTYPFSFEGGLNGVLNDPQCGCYLTYLTSNKRVVIDNVSATAQLPVGQMVEIDIHTDIDAGAGLAESPSIYHPFVPMNKVSGGKDWYVLNERTNLHSSPNNSVFARVKRSSGTGVAEVTVNIAGYLED